MAEFHQFEMLRSLGADAEQYKGQDARSHDIENGQSQGQLPETVESGSIEGVRLRTPFVREGYPMSAAVDSGIRHAVVGHDMTHRRDGYSGRARRRRAPSDSPQEVSEGQTRPACVGDARAAARPLRSLTLSL